ncbi:E3 ubiquitin-protein ligase E3D-like [Macrobrachium nipponense]|uniref:E3 ubiquitin-protein ligase E3D-like n=1 Tax=Macrobrachium nipponense TaxID=159736 RepID=UPI0030C81640
MLQVLAEILPNIKVCNIYITSSYGERCEKVDLCKAECILEFEDGTTMIISLPRGTYLVPQEITDINQDGDTLFVRASLDETCSLISTLSAELGGNIGNLCAAAPLHDIMVGKCVSCYCKKCHSAFQKDVTFRRVLPLPSVDWDHSSEGWFCHVHGEESKNLKPASLAPNHDECFYSEFFFLLNCSALNSMNIYYDDDDNDFKCSNCRDSLGEKGSSTMKLWTHSVKWIHSDDETVLFSKSVESILHSLFENIDKDSFGVNCRLVLSTDNPKLYLFMVTMNTNQKLLLSESHSDDELLEDGDASQGKKARTGNDTNVKLRKRYAIKLLYQIKEGDDDESGSWQDDVNVHILPCSSSFFTDVRSLLESSSMYLPPAMRTFQNMKVGYVMKS